MPLDVSERAFFPDGPPTETAQLLEEIAAFVRRYLVMTEHQTDAVALWAAHTHVRKPPENPESPPALAFRRTPYLWVTSAEKECGKTLLLEVLRLLVPEPWLTERVSVAALIRKVEKDRPTLLLDESDNAFKSGKEYAAALVGLLNSGYRRDGTASLCIPPSWNVQDFSTFCPKAIAGIGTLPDTTASRSIPIRLHRRAPNEQVEDFFEEDVEEEAAELRGRLARWGEVHAAVLADSRPAFPGGLRNRTAEVARPLLAIADLAGGEWPERARRVLVALLAGEERQDEWSLRVRLLADIRRIFDEEKRGRFKTAELLWALSMLDDSPWGDWYGKPITAHAVSKLLSKFGIKTMAVKVDGETVRGYKREQFEDAWLRYLPQESVTGVTAVTGGSAPEAERNAGNATDAAPGPEAVEGNGRLPDERIDSLFEELFERAASDCPPNVRRELVEDAVAHGALKPTTRAHTRR